MIGVMRRVPDMLTRIVLPALEDLQSLQVWSADLDAPEFVPAVVSELATDEERQRASRFHNVRDARRFLARRCCVRQLVASFLDIDPKELLIMRIPGSKPIVDTPGLTRPARFSTSTSENQLVVAVSSECELGIDVEHLRPFPDWELIATQFFAASETDFLRSGRETATTEFLRLWTAKEAVLKAVGVGVTDLMNQFAVEIDAPASCTIRWLAPSCHPWKAIVSGTWKTVLFSPAPGFTAALAVFVR
jgi:4'-phosphopantetheinyl transferase